MKIECVDEEIKELVKKEYDKPLSELSLYKKHAPLTTKIIDVFHSNSISVSEALKILEETEFVLKQITIV